MMMMMGGIKTSSMVVRSMLYKIHSLRFAWAMSKCILAKMTGQIYDDINYGFYKFVCLACFGRSSVGLL